MKTNKLSKRLAQYGMLAAGLTGMQEAGAAIIYTDEVPDFTGGLGSQYLLDVNNDGIDDFNIFISGYSSSYFQITNLYIAPLAAGNGVLASTSSSSSPTYVYGLALNAGSPINAGAGTFYNNGFTSSNYNSLNYGSCSYGNWCSVTDKYLGLKFQVGGVDYYGWARLDVDANGTSFTVKDYAYEDIANTSINAGEMASAAVVADSASNVVAMDVADNANGLDLSVSFDAAMDETTINEYRVVVVKEDSAVGFDLTKANALTATQYTAVTPAGTPNYGLVLSSTSLDEDGDLIVLGVPYKVFVLSVADGTIASTNNLSSASNSVTLNTQVEVVSLLTAIDVDDNIDGSDIQVDFQGATNESNILEYRLIAVKAANSGSFTLSDAQAITATSYTAVIPASSPYSLVLDATQQDSDGDGLVLGEPYTVFALSVADGVLANMDSLSTGTISVTLTTQAAKASNVTALDIADNGNGLDAEISFDAASTESGIAAYQIMIVKESQAASFNITSAASVAVGDYTEVSVANMTNYTQVLSASATDVNGDAIVEDELYQAFVYSKSDSTAANLDNLSDASASFELKSADDTTAINDVLFASSKVFLDGNKNIVIELSDNLISYKSIQASLYNLLGKNLQSIQLENKVNRLNASALSKGIYLVVLDDNNGATRTYKLLIK